MEDSIKVYSLPGCGMCKALKRELESRNISYEDCQDIDLMKSLGILHTPIMEVNGQRYDFKSAIAYLKGLGK